MAKSTHLSLEVEGHSGRHLREPPQETALTSHLQGPETWLWICMCPNDEINALESSGIKENKPSTGPNHGGVPLRPYTLVTS